MSLAAVPDAAVLASFLEDTATTESCHALACGESHIDRVLVRSNDAVHIDATTWAVAEEFITSDGLPLSDHPAIVVELTWSATTTLPATASAVCRRRGSREMAPRDDGRIAMN